MTTRRTRILFVLTLLLIGAVLLLLILRPTASTDTAATATKSAEPAGKPRESSVQGFGPSGASEGPADAPSVEAPQDKTLRLTVPKMDRVSDAVVPTAHGGDEQALKANAGIHLDGTGYPWQKEANVYIAGHREGFPGTPSHLAFHDLDVLEPGDSVVLTDGDGNTYSYKVSEKRVVAAGDLSVLRTTPNESVVTLQSCTLPDYAERLVVRAEKEA